MGLDSLELVLEVEETFDIKIPDEAAEQAVTVGDLYGIVIALAKQNGSQRCVSASVFRLIRQNVERLGMATRIRPSTKLCEVFPVDFRRDLWRVLSHETGFKFPPLVLPMWITSSASVLAVLLSLALALCLAAFSTVLAVVAFFVSAYVVYSVIMELASPYAVEFQSNWRSFRGLTQEVMWRNGEKIGDMYGPLSPQDTWMIVQNLVSVQLGVAKEKVTKQARFVEDLGLE